MVDGACAYLTGPISSAPSAWLCDLTETLKVQPAVDPIATTDWPEKARLDAVMTLLKASLVTRRARVFHFIETRTGDADWPFASRAGLPFDIRVETFSFGSGVEHRAGIHASYQPMDCMGLQGPAQVVSSCGWFLVFNSIVDNQELVFSFLAMTGLLTWKRDKRLL
jgi:hypothetical protein